MLKQQTKLRVRLYARLSKDDGDADKESNSITNQLQMLRYNAKEKGFEVIGEYVDDGYSGTTFNRPDLNRMIKDAMDDPEPSGIMVKDMSVLDVTMPCSCIMLKKSFLIMIFCLLL